MNNEKITRTVVLAMALVAMAVPALAGDLCLQLFGDTYIGKGVKLPKAGRCTPWRGFLPAGVYCPEVSVSTGTLCTKSDDSVTIGHIMTSCLSDGTVIQRSDHFELPRPTLTGGVDRFSTIQASPGSSTTSGVAGPGSAAVIACPEKKMPIQ